MYVCICQPNRGADELKRQLRDTESELKAQERRYEGTVSAHRKELGAALAEADDARGLANELRDSLQARNGKRGLVKCDWLRYRRLVGDWPLSAWRDGMGYVSVG